MESLDKTQWGSLFLWGLGSHPEHWKAGGWNHLNACSLSSLVVDVAAGWGSKAVNWKASPCGLGFPSTWCLPLGVSIFRRAGFMGLGPVQSHRAPHSKGLHTCCHCLQMFNFLSKGLFIFTLHWPQRLCSWSWERGRRGRGRMKGKKRGSGRRRGRGRGRESKS